MNSTPPQTIGKFSKFISLQSEMRWFASLGESDPGKKSFIFTSGEEMVQLAKGGELSKFRSLISSMEQEEILMYFVTKALVASVLSGHLMVAGYIIDNGYPLNADGIPNVLIESLKVMENYQCIPVINMLAGKKMDINKQEPSSWLSPLHIAVRRGLVDAVEILLILGADANIVAAADLMPLNAAYALPEGADKEIIIERLLQSGARGTWRRNTLSSNSDISNDVSTISTAQIGVVSNKSTEVSCVHTIIGRRLLAPTKQTATAHSQSSVVAGGSIGNSGSCGTGNRVRFNSANLTPVVFALPLPLPPPSDSKSQIAPHSTVCATSSPTALSSKVSDGDKSLGRADDEFSNGVALVQDSDDGAQLFSTG